MSGEKDKPWVFVNGVSNDVRRILGEAVRTYASVRDDRMKWVRISQRGVNVSPEFVERYWINRDIFGAASVFQSDSEAYSSAKERSVDESSARARWNGYKDYAAAHSTRLGDCGLAHI